MYNKLCWMKQMNEILVNFQAKHLPRGTCGIELEDILR